MISQLIIALGLVAVIEGLVIALAPKRLEEAVKFLNKLPVEQRRYLGLAIMALGVLVIWIAT
ncbi:MAG: DUF2065 domain-containing protein [Rhodobacteraceae bacterium]|nr:DUF2065 domain-containing protein [Paracoccaceae bacterium]